jgi:hypothetical protein
VIVQSPTCCLDGADGAVLPPAISIASPILGVQNIIDRHGSLERENIAAVIPSADAPPYVDAHVLESMPETSSGIVVLKYSILLYALFSSTRAIFILCFTLWSIGYKSAGISALSTFFFA